MHHRPRPRRRSRGPLLVAIAAGGAAALAVAAPALGEVSVGGGTVEVDVSVMIKGDNVEPTTATGKLRVDADPARKNPAGGDLQDGRFNIDVTGSKFRARGGGTIRYGMDGRDTPLDPLGLNRWTRLDDEVAIEFSSWGSRVGNQAAPVAPVAFAIAALQVPPQQVESFIPNGPQATIPQAALRNNHYKCYLVTDVVGRNRNRSLQLIDQFARYSPKAIRPYEVCNPVRKVVGKKTTRIRDRRRHLVSYTLSKTKREVRQPSVRNQFVNQLTSTGNLVHLMVPSAKQHVRGARNTVPRGARPGPRPDHFACYQANGRPQNQVFNLTLFDQFEGKRHRLGPINSVCNPTVKRYKRKTTRIRYPLAHLAGYALNKQGSPRRTVRVTNQFGEQTLRTGRATRILVPSAKRHCVRFTATPNAQVTSVATRQPVGTINEVTVTPHEGDPQGACPNT